jgi:hypothetical protein
MCRPPPASAPSLRTLATAPPRPLEPSRRLCTAHHRATPAPWSQHRPPPPCPCAARRRSRQPAALPNRFPKSSLPSRSRSEAPCLPHPHLTPTLAATHPHLPEGRNPSRGAPARRRSSAACHGAGRSPFQGSNSKQATASSRRSQTVIAPPRRATFLLRFLDPLPPQVRNSSFSSPYRTWRADNRAPYMCLC